jgi:ABC-type transport system involved in multi-copper enzyme maturation permease subunit
MIKILAIATNTFKEAVRNRILYMLLVFALIIMASSGVVGELTVTARERIIKDLGVSSINFFGLLIAIFVGIGLVYNELDKKTIYTIVTKPIDRSQFLIGKYFGLLLTIYVNVLIMTFFFLAVINYQSLTNSDVMTKALWTQEASGVWNSPGVFDYGFYYVKAIALSCLRSLGTFTFLYHPEPDITQNVLTVIIYGSLELAIITAFAILYSSFSTPVLSALLTILTFVIGRLNADIIIFADRMVRQKGLETISLKCKYGFAWLAAHITPNLWLFNKSSSLDETAGILKMDYWAIGYCILYTGAILFLAVNIFKRRNFK